MNVGDTEIYGFALTLAGCPYVFTTCPPGEGVVDDYSLLDDTADGATWLGEDAATKPVYFANGFLDWPDFAITERARPIDGDIELDPVRFRLLDDYVTEGGAGAIGQRLMTYLAGTDPDNIEFTHLTSALSVSTTVWDVLGTGAFVANQYAWCEQECVYVTALTATTLTVTRAQLGTQARAHAIEQGEGVQPEVWDRMPWIQRRKAIFYALVRVHTAAGLVRCVRPIGYYFTGGAPDLGSDGITFELPCTPAWDIIKDSAVSDNLGSVKLAGIGSNGGPPHIGGHIGMDTESWAGHSDRGRYSTWELMAQTFLDRAVPGLSLLSQVSNDTVHAMFRRDGAGGVYSIDFQSGATIVVGACTMHVPSGQPPGQPRTITIPAEYTSRTSNVHALVFRQDVCPQVGYQFSLQGNNNTFGVESLYALDRVLTYTVGSSSPRHTAVEYGLRMKLSEDWNVAFTGINTFTNYFTSRCLLEPRRAGLTPVETESLDNKYWFFDPPPLAVVMRVQCDHWADGLRYALLPQLDTTDGVSDWDWTTYPSLIVNTAGPRARRSWTFDGTAASGIGKIVAESFLMNGCSLGTRHGRLSIVQWQLPTSIEVSAAEFVEAEMTEAFNPWGVWREGIVNSITLKSESLTLNLVNERSQRRYGKGRTVVIELAGVELERLRSLDPGTLYRELLSRMDLWSAPVSIVQFKTSIARMFDAFIGDMVALSDYTTPDGAGGRGLDAQRGRVLGRSIDFASGTMTFDVLLFRRDAHPYAPVLKCVQDRTGLANNEVTVEQFYPGTWAASGYSDWDTFLEVYGVNEQWTFHERDTQTAFTETPSGTLLAVTPNGGTDALLEFNSNLSATLRAKISAGLWIDATLYLWSAANGDTTRAWAWVADESTGYIATSAPAHRIAP